MSKNAVVIISQEFPPDTNTGGIATFNFNLAQLLSQNQKVIVITGNLSWKNSKTTLAKNIEIHQVGLCFQNKFLRKMFSLWPRKIITFPLFSTIPLLTELFLWNFFSWRYFESLKKSVTIDEIHTHIYRTPALFIRLLNKNIPMTAHAQGPQFIQIEFETNNLETTAIILLEKVFLKFEFKRIIACSENLRKRMRAALPNLKNTIEVVPNFLDFSVYQHHFSFNKKSFLFFGRKEYRKGADILLNSFAQIQKSHPDQNLTLIGADGSNFPTGNTSHASFKDLLQIQQAKHQHSLNIFSIPEIKDRSALLKILQKYRGIAVFPARYEPFGFTTIEAMAAGYVVIVSDKSGGSEIITDGYDGFLIQPTASSLTKTLEHVLSLPNKKLQEISNNAQLTVQMKFSLKAVKNDYLK